MSNYLAVPSGGGASTPHQAGLVIGASTLDVRIKVAADTWGTGAAQTLVDSSDWSDTNARWFLELGTDGRLSASWFNAAFAQQSGDTGAVTVPSLGFPNGTAVWLRVVMAPSAGTLAFYWSADGSAWTQIGSTLTGFTTTGVNTAGTPPKVAIGQTSAFGGVLLVGKIYNTQILVGVSTILNMDWTTAALGNGTWTATTGEVWTRFGTSSVVVDPASSHGLGLLGVGA